MESCTCTDVPITIFRGDDTDGLGYQSIKGKITTVLDLTGCKAVFRYLGFTQTIDPIPESGRFIITIPSDITAKFPPGMGFASLRVYDQQGKVRTFTNRIPVFVTMTAPAVVGGDFTVEFSGGALNLEPLKIWTVNGFVDYDGYIERIIDKATADRFGLAMLKDTFESGDDADSGIAATPKSVNAAYAAILAELTNNYYTAEETEEKIDSLAAYYITSNAAGDAFPTKNALITATAYYSGGAVRIPTRNDYAVVLADETHGGAEWRYIYATNGEGGQWEAQYPIETNDYAALSNKPSINNVTLSGNKTSSDLGLLGNSGDQTLDGTLAISGETPIKIVGGKIIVDPDSVLKSEITIPYKVGVDGVFALLSDIYAAVQQIAPEWVSGTTYNATAKVSYNGVVYARKTSGSITSSTNPASDTTNWQAKKVSELFLPLSGGTMTTGSISLNRHYLYTNIEGPDGGTPYLSEAELSIVDNETQTLYRYGSIVLNAYLDSERVIWMPSDPGVFALLQNIAPDYSISETYALNELCVHEKRLYRCTTAITTAEAWTSAHWTDATVEDVLAALRGKFADYLPLSGGIVSGDIGANSFSVRIGNSSVADIWYDSALKLFLNGGYTITFPNSSGTLALLSDLATKLDSTSAAPAFSTASTYAVDEHCTYNGKLYRCTTAVTVAGAWDASKWTADTMTDPDAVLDITSQNQLRVVAKDGTVLWSQGYDLASTSSATLACDAVNNFTFADGATTQAFALPTAPTGKIGDFILDIDNSTNTGAATMTLTGLDTTFSAVVQEGESLTDMLSIAAGELARFYITLTSFRVNNLPTWQIVKQVVENGGATV